MAPMNPQRHQETRPVTPASQGVRQNQASASSFYSPPFPSPGVSVQTSRSWHATGHSHSVVSTQYRGQPVVERTQCYSSDSHRMQNAPPVIEDYDLGFFENPEDGDLDAGDFFDD
ncbi:hypothetical protein K440DRAFT_160945 [Wilcoxina mikolae CBS 423.85]|nr:hypothetical protein K440DRAFT_160945 [Wilcoxina mikolae CBS 423.85]